MTGELLGAAYDLAGWLGRVVRHETFIPWLLLATAVAA